MSSRTGSRSGRVPRKGGLWATIVPLRVEDDPAPLRELRRLMVVHEAYELASEADLLAGEGRHDEAAPVHHARVGARA